MMHEKKAASQLTLTRVIGGRCLAGLSKPHGCSSCRSSWFALLLGSAQHLRLTRILNDINPPLPNPHTLTHTHTLILMCRTTRRPTLPSSLPWHKHTSLHTHRVEGLREHFTRGGSTNKASYLSWRLFSWTWAGRWGSPGRRRVGVSGRDPPRVETPTCAGKEENTTPAAECGRGGRRTGRKALVRIKYWKEDWKWNPTVCHDMNVLVGENDVHYYSLPSIAPSLPSSVTYHRFIYEFLQNIST